MGILDLVKKTVPHKAEDDDDAVEMVAKEIVPTCRITRTYIYAGERVELLTLPKQQIKSCLPRAYILTQAYLHETEPGKKEKKKKKATNAVDITSDITACIRVYDFIP